MPLNPTQQPRQRIDFSDLSSATQELQKLVDGLDSMVDDCADARTVLEFNSERSKAVFSAAVVAAYKAGAKSTASAEHDARVQPSYEHGMAELREQHTIAERVRLRYEAAKIKCDAIRTLISAMKTSAGF